MTNVLSNNREQWLNSAAALLMSEKVLPATNLPLPLYRISIDSPNTRTRKSTVLGTCWRREASDDNHNEIFITASFDCSDSVRILDVLLHELIHAVDNCENGHNQTFAKYCRAVGLRGGATARSNQSFTATVATDELREYLAGIVDEIGEIPHGKLNASLAPKPKQKSRNVKVECDSCDFKFRTSQKCIDSMTSFNCLSCGSGQLSTND